MPQVIKAVADALLENRMLCLIGSPNFQAQTFRLAALYMRY